MIKALLWKEYRESRLSLALTSFGSTVIFWLLFFSKMHWQYMSPQGSLEVMILPLPGIISNYPIIPLITVFTIITGADSFASEYQSKTFDFLVSRAVSRETVWHSKFGLRFSMLFFPIFYFIFINCFLHTKLAGLQYQGMFIGATILLFSMCFFFSTIFSRPFIAGVTGIIVFLGFAMLFYQFFKNYLAFSICSIILSNLILRASFAIFTKGRFLHARNKMMT